MPYVAKKCVQLLAADQKALLIWDVFRGQLTDNVKEGLGALNIECVYVPANMTLFPTLGPDSEWMCKAKDEEGIYSSAVKQQLDSGKQLEDIEAYLYSGHYIPSGSRFVYFYQRL